MAHDNYGRLFRSMYTGSMYGAGACVFAVWTWVIANKDENGIVEINPICLANTLGEPVKNIEQAIEYLCNPDPRSRTKLEEGRRLIRTGEFEHKVVTHTVQEDRGRDRTEYWREYRAKKRAEVAKKADVHSEQSEQSEQSTKNTHVDVTVAVPVTVPVTVKKPLFSENSDPVVFSETLLRNIKTLGLTIKEPDIQKWAVHIDRMIRIDKILPHEITQVLEWIFLDPPKDGWPGWGSVILSTATLREKFPKIISRMKAISQREDPEETLKRLQAKGYC